MLGTQAREKPGLRFEQDAEGNYKLPSNEVETIKQELIGLMITCPPAIQTQLGEAISLIADSDFWERWQTLVTVRSVLGRKNMPWAC
jgi:hypothetical protein